MARFVAGQELSEAIQTVLSGRRQDMAVAFWGRDACDHLAMPSDASGSRVACDARSGGCNPVAIAELLKRNVTIRDVPGLHAKVYIGENGVVVGSANATANGLGEESEELSDSLEAGYVSERQEDIKKAEHWFQAIFDRGDVVDKSHLPEIRALWRERQTHRPARDKRFLHALRNAPDQLGGRGLKVAIYSSEYPPSETKEDFKKTPFYDEKSHENADYYPFFWRTKWNIEVGDLILCLEGVAKDKIACYGTWRVLAVLKHGALVPAVEVKKPIGMGLSRTDGRDLAKQVQALVKQGVLEMDGPLLTIEDFARKLRNSSRK